MENFTIEELKNSIHEALNTFPVNIWNGEDKPKSVSLPEGITIISQEVKNVKKDVAGLKDDVKEVKNKVQELNKEVGEHNKLLSGIKQRKQLFVYVADVIKLAKSMTVVRVLWWIIIHASAIYGGIEAVREFLH